MRAGSLTIALTGAALAAASVWLLLASGSDAPTSPASQPAPQPGRTPAGDRAADGPRRRLPAPAPHKRDQTPSGDDAPPASSAEVDLAVYERATWLAAAAARFEQGDHEGVLELGNQLLADQPSDGEVLRWVVLSACALGEAALAREHAPRLAGRARADAQNQCREQGVELLLAPSPALRTLPDRPQQVVPRTRDLPKKSL